MCSFFLLGPGIQSIIFFVKQFDLGFGFFFFSFFSSTFRQTHFSTLSTIDPVLLRQYPPPSHNPYAPPGQRGPGFGQPWQDLFFVPC
jgi:hypothetical protein